MEEMKQISTEMITENEEMNEKLTVMKTENDKMDQKKTKKLKTQFDNYDSNLKYLFELIETLRSTNSNKITSDIYYEYKNLVKKTDQIKEEKFTIFFFGRPGDGKSYFINFLINGNSDYPLPSNNSRGNGLTKKPIKIFFSIINTITVIGYGKNRENFTKEITVEQKDDYLKDLLDNLNKDDSIDYITIEYPEKLLSKDHYSLNKFVLVDLVGVPDQESSIIANKNFIDTVACIDAIFYVSKGRGKITEEDIRNMYKCSLFQKCSKFSSPIIVSIALFEFNTAHKENSPNKEIVNSIRESLSKAFDFDLGRLKFLREEKTSNNSSTNDEIKEDLYIQSKMHSVGKIVENSDEIVLMKSETGKGLDEKSCSEFNERILEKIKEFKKKCVYLDCFHQAYIILFTLKSKKDSSERRKKKDKDNVYKRIYDILYLNSKEYDKVLKSTKLNIENILEEFNKEIKTNSSNIFEIFTSYSPVLYEKIEKFITFIQNKINKLISNNQQDEKKLDEFEIFFTESKDLAKNFTSINNQNQINEKIRNFSANSAIEIKKLLQKFLEDFRYKIIEKNIPEASELNNLANMSEIIIRILEIIHKNRNDLEKSLYGSFEVSENICDNPPDPIRFESSNTNKIPNFLDQEIENEDFRKRISKLKENQFISKSLKETDIKNILRKLKDLYAKANNLKMEVSDLNEENELITLKNDSNIGNEIQIYIDPENKRVEAWCNKKKIDKDLENLNDKVKKFRHIFFEPKNKIVNCLNNDKNEPSLEPIFIWCNLEKAKESFLLKELKNNLKEENFRIFLFFEIGDLINDKIVLNEKIRHFCQVFFFDKKSFNSITFVLINGKQLKIGKGHILKLMFMIAKLLNISNFFYIGENVREFQEFNGNKHKPSLNSSIRALTFMSKTMFMAVKDCDKKSKNSEMDLQYFLKEEEINSLNNFIMDLPQYFNETEKSEIKVLRQLINDNIRDNLNGKNGNVQNSNILFLKDKLKIKEYISNYELENNCQILDIFEKYFQFLSGPNMTTIGQVTLKKRNGKGYDTFLDRLIGTSNATHTVCKDQEVDVIFYNMNAIKTLHPISDESFFNSCNFYNDQLVNEYYYYKMVNFVSNVLLYYFTYDTDID